MARAANPAPYYLLIGDAIVLPLLPQGDGWVATTCVTQRTLTPTRRRSEIGTQGLARRAQAGAAASPVLKGRRCSSPPTPPAGTQPSTC